MESVQAEANKITNIVKDEKIRESLRAKKFDPKAVVQGLCKSCDTKIKAFDPVIKAFEKAAG